MREHLGDHYDRTSTFQQGRFDTLAEIIKTTLPDLGSLRSMLDIGCGSGGRTVQCFDIFPNLEHITAIDPDWEMIETAEKKYKDPRVTYRRFSSDDIPKLGAEGLKYDVAFSNFSIHWIENKDKLLQDLHAVVNPGGYLVFSASQQLPDILTMIDEYLRRELNVPDAQKAFFHENAEALEKRITKNQWRIIRSLEEIVHRDVESGSAYLDKWFSSSTTKATYGKHLVELSPLSRSDIGFMMEQAFPGNTPGMELHFTENVMFMVAQRD